MNKIINVSGMSCEHCIKRITNAINEIDGAKCINISLENETIEIEYLNEEILRQIEDTIIDLGYEIV